MKPTKKKLSLKKENLVTLSDTELARVDGGAGSFGSCNGTCWSCKSCIYCPGAGPQGPQE